MKTLMGAVVVVMGLGACAGLSLKETDTGWEQAGKVAARVVWCPLTVCVSELVIAGEAEREAYARWYWRQSPEARQRISEMNLRRAQLFIGLGGFQGMRQPLPQIQYPPVSGGVAWPSRRAMTCTSRTVEPITYTNCE